MSPKLFPPSLPCLFIHFLACVSASEMPRLSISGRPNWKNLKAKSNSPALNDLKEVYYTQTLDHFNYRPDSYKTFKQRYFINTKYWGGANSSSPIFAYLGAEQPITNDLVVAGFLNDNAPDFKALIVFIEHRYYGESVPFGSLDNAFHSTNTLGYFTSTQALADYAEVLMSLKKNLSAESCPIIVMGGSYGGMLASWFRLKYPHIAMGALASSAPILYFEDIVPQDIYYVIATNDYKEASMNCYKTIRKSWSVINKIASQANGLSLLSKIFKTCKPINDSSELRDYLDGMYTQAAQYDAPPNYPVNRICDGIDKASKATADTLSRIAAGVVAFNGNKKCYDLQAGNIVTYDRLGWFWQTCTDLAISMGRNHENTMFSVAPYSLENYTKACQQTFDATLKARPHWIVNEFGGRNIKRVLKKFGSNIIFSNGLRDPYSGGGVLRNISNTLVAIHAAEGSHCLDILGSSKDDPIWLTKMRASIVKILKDWIAEYYKMLRS
ncbi:hypothetical protein AQUCO_00901040v1 [Aquilegia coerulea]|uniref:Serine carboxypeptidase S28 family protein n=1 Tax=Aquilegia coerulea TaxID=218851 RepID=A0A2G5EGG9_AQUCA|nr:hypothetical protein AQUCO_00901040v1 [Aquilegia coerulea]